ncbi:MULTISPECIES: mechanosensitive ion channel domain-containing protein [Pseudoalteromonas]|jgi:miniconductance mechanosensitive channel|uniref:Mechanosensing system component YbdG n=2 Tax=Pseudoalteromonas TaxID=53246 RepID=Q3IIA0_PSET1|nr:MULTISPECIES: mechanosensitive ion channel domain-containing protein [Pseudoalteromonas]MBB1372234.1 mechanosensitive ion channel [Pseudoalteromonas sp. SR45-4]MBB1405823.1 mechanosensitive ion channel [Pseudoalteromonas sp. SG44-5]MBH0070438.1 mechanosensitive ion channel [Pseudoalteromonas sp. NZS127]MBH0091644.1 mechanosensitive ion channel [Pseudoalteromonas sp. SCQQ13]MBO7925856.1 mechanosensitive ion channel [Pseudoalteromonas sp. K222D]|tara:strand:+ start:14345 stop:15616 length:1272 start_codon:yes stop_codon:yes gene_type:complete
MTDIRAELREYLLGWFGQYLPANPLLWYDILVLCWLAIFAIILHLIIRNSAKHFLKGRFSERIVQPDAKTPADLAFKLAKHISFVIQGAVVVIQARLWIPEGSSFLHIIEMVTDQWIILFSLLSLFSLLDIFQVISDRRAVRAHFPIRGLLQTIKLIASVLTGILAVSLLMNKSPLILLSGLGALSAVMLLVFKDAILGLVAGIQLSANNMLAVGDWLEMPKYGADGDVIDIALTTVKVRNWDKTITTIPTYALISDSFKNWRGMSESGGRRIKRSIHLEMNSVRFLNEQELTELRKANLLTKYIDTTISSISAENASKDMSCLLNGRRLTNVGTFRHYLIELLKQHPKIHQNMTLMVRQLEPTNKGLPIEIYTFTNTTVWAEYEGIQADIFDHILAILPVFYLKAHESPTGNDVRSLSIGKL